MARRIHLKAGPLRIALWLLMASACAVLLLWPTRPPRAPWPSTAEVPRRAATAAEWALPITDLGRQRLAKQVAWAFVRRDLDPGAQGDLAWWHDGSRERVGYLRTADEDGPQARSRLFMDLFRGRDPGAPPPAIILGLHGQADILAVIGNERQDDLQFPVGWTLLTPPTSP